MVESQGIMSTKEKSINNLSNGLRVSYGVTKVFH